MRACIIYDLYDIYMLQIMSDTFTVLFTISCGEKHSCGKVGKFAENQLEAAQGHKTDSCPPAEICVLTTHNTNDTWLILPVVICLS